MLSLIVARASNGVIGKDNQLPWFLPADLKYFKAVTMGKPIVMGRKTFESIGRPLPGRQNIVVTRNVNFISDGITVVHSVEAAIAAANAVEEVMLIGGSELYKLSLPLADRIYLTEIYQDFDGDAHFPPLASQWREISREDHVSDDGLAYSFCIFDR
jgi:dihydrofolate reductase|tara:strand:- start:5685 stop:6155 length:471 start_codon:yes stop_codon:yes gene_type:complete